YFHVTGVQTCALPILKQDLIALGIPKEKIYLDYAGFRTLDSILRCKEVFGEVSISVISQPFHNQRAVYIAHKKDIAAIAYNAKRSEERSVGKMCRYGS